MSYELAYTTHFRSLNNTLWDIDIYLLDYKDDPLEIKLEGDEPCVIDWQETDKMDVIQSSTCTLRVSNESDRQMVQLMFNRDAYVHIKRNNNNYWKGFLDDAVYEEPYSYSTAYVTELVFSDFGILNRIPFLLTGTQSLDDIVKECLVNTGHYIRPVGGSMSGGNSIPYILYTSLVNPDTNQGVTLDELYINTDRFSNEDSDTMCREVLDDILRPLGLRIMQKNGSIYIYDIEYLRDTNGMNNYIAWKGTDAHLRGSDSFTNYDVSFEHDALETLAEERHDYLDNYVMSDRFFLKYYDEDANETVEGFYISLYSYHGETNLLNPNGRIFRTRSNVTSSDDKGYAWRAKAYDRSFPFNALYPSFILDNAMVNNIASAESLFKIESVYIPISPDSGKYQLKVNLDFLLSPKLNPFEGDEDWNVEYGDIPDYDNWKENLLQIYVPVKLELLDEGGNVLMHYRNIWRGDYTPLDPGEGEWVSGSGDFGDMMLAYYNNGLEETALEGWATNKQTMLIGRKHQPSLYKKRADGEYVPMPSEAGTLRLTVSNCVFSPKQVDNQWIVNFRRHIGWQLYRNAKIEIVRDKVVEDRINTDSIMDRDHFGLYGNLSETLKVGCWCKDVPPSSRGLLFDSNGDVLQNFIKNGKTKTLQEHRMKSLEDQNANIHPVLSGTAELDTTFRAKRDASTQGLFLVTALRQDLHEDTEEVTMVRIANVGGYVYEYEWTDPVCAKIQDSPYEYEWSDPICVKIDKKI